MPQGTETGRVWQRAGAGWLEPSEGLAETLPPSQETEEKDPDEKCDLLENFLGHVQLSWCLRSSW